MFALLYCMAAFDMALFAQDTVYMVSIVDTAPVVDIVDIAD